MIKIGWPNGDRPAVPLLHVLGLDPGVETGWAYLRCDAQHIAQKGFSASVFSPGWNVAHGGIDCKAEISGVTDMVNITREVWMEVDQEEGDLFLVALEDFVLYRMGSDRDLLAPVRLSAAYRDRMRDFRYPCLRQSSSDAKITLPDGRLRMWNLCVPGPDHWRDAIRHACLAARKFASDRRTQKWVREMQWREDAS